MDFKHYAFDKPSEAKPRGRQEGRTLVDVLRLTSPGKKTLADIKMKTDHRAQHGETNRFVKSAFNLLNSDNTLRPKEQQLAHHHIGSAIAHLETGKQRTTENGWTIEKVPADIQPMRRYDPARDA